MKDYKSLLSAPVYFREEYIQKTYPELYKETQKLPVDISFKEKLYWILHDIKTYPLCPVCGKRITFTNITHGYHQFCSLKCSNNSSDVQSKKVQTSLSRHGVRHFQNIEKIKQTKLEKYGDPNYVNPKKSKQTCLERYGTESYMSTQEFKDRSKQTKLEKYGDPNYANPEKRKQTCLERYGVETNMMTPEFQNQSRLSCIERYGVEYPSQSQEIQSKIRNSTKQSLINHIPEVLSITDDGLYVCNCPHDECKKCLDRTYLTTSTTLYNRKKNNIELCTNLCPINRDMTKDTSIEIFVQLILDHYHVNYIKNDRSILNGQELDIYIPDHNLAIECNGIRWHSTNNDTPKDKHYNKYMICQSLGIQLLTIWEDQIINSPQIVESIILSKLNIYKENIYARKCQIREVSNQACETFLNKYHMQKNTKGSSVRLGLFYNNELVSVMTFGKTRKYTGGSKDLWELHRYCCKEGVHVIGGASKLFHNFLKEYKVSLIESFSSNDISNGQLYKTLGFQQDSFSKSYWYIDKYYRRYHRYNFTKYKLVKIGFDSGMSEYQIMKSRGYYQIYDTGQTRWLYKNQNDSKETLI